MENYGRKIIDYIFGWRSNSSAVSYEREQKIQANSDRSDIRVFETGISLNDMEISGKARELLRKRNVIG